MEWYSSRRHEVKGLWFWRWSVRGRYPTLTAIGACRDAAVSDSRIITPAFVQ
jgi:hypothetical protein